MKMNYLIILVWLNIGCHKDPIVPIIVTDPCLSGICDTSKIEIVLIR
jgi:hypothetical protein